MTFFANKFFAAIMSVMLAGATLALSVTDADAQRRRFLAGAAVGAVAAGIGAAIANRRRRERVIYVQPRRVYRAAPRRVIRAAPRRVYGNRAAACAAKYRSYDPASDTYVSYSGVVRRCRL